jgi:hypothetical protein
VADGWFALRWRHRHRSLVGGGPHPNPRKAAEGYRLRIYLTCIRDSGLPNHAEYSSNAFKFAERGRVLLRLLSANSLPAEKRDELVEATPEHSAGLVSREFIRDLNERRAELRVQRTDLERELVALSRPKARCAWHPVRLCCSRRSAWRFTTIGSLARRPNAGSEMLRATSSRGWPIHGLASSPRSSSTPARRRRPPWLTRFVSRIVRYVPMNPPRGRHRYLMTLSHGPPWR